MYYRFFILVQLLLHFIFNAKLPTSRGKTYIYKLKKFKKKVYLHIFMISYIVKNHSFHNIIQISTCIFLECSVVP